MPKKCTKCHELKALDEFYKDATTKSGVRSPCRKCVSVFTTMKYAANPKKFRVRARRFYAANKENIRAKARESYAANAPKERARTRVWQKANPEKAAATKRAWNAANPERRAAYRRAWYEANPGYSRVHNAAWEKANPECRAALVALRRARKRGNGIFVVTAKEVKALMAKPCYICESAPSEHLDHIVPLCRGGRHSVGNLAGACATCNLRKGGMLLIQFKQSILTPANG